MAQVLPTTYEYVNAAGETITATKSWVLDWQQVKDAAGLRSEASSGWAEI